MDPTDIGLFREAERRLAWADTRQQLLAQNVANANTPGYSPRDVAPFASVLASGTLAARSLVETSPLHMAAATDGPAGIQQRPHARMPNGNGVSIEEQLTKVADTAGIQELTLNLHRRYQSMLRTALGRPG